MADYKFTDEAEHDLEEITNYTLQKWDIAQTLAYLDELETLGQLLADNPDGTKRDTVPDGLLSFPYENHTLYYMKQSHGITVVRILHQRMDPMRYF